MIQLGADSKAVEWLTSLLSSCSSIGTSAEEGPVAKMTEVVPVALMGWVAWSRGRTTVSVTLEPVWLKDVKVLPEKPGLAAWQAPGKQGQLEGQ